MKKISEVSRVAGVTKRALQYYDNEGLLPAQRSKENYRLYGDEAIEMVWKILILKEAGFELEEIKEIFAADDKLKHHLYVQKIRQMTVEKEQLNNKIQLIKTIEEHGTPPVAVDSGVFVNYVQFIDAFGRIFSSKKENKKSEFNFEFGVTKAFREWLEANCKAGSYDVLMNILETYLEKSK